MTWLARLFGSALLLFATTAHAQTCESLAKRWQAVFSEGTQSLWLLPAPAEESNASNHGFTSNIVLAIDEKNIWLIGSMGLPSSGKNLACSVSKRFKRKISDVIQTRPHPEAVMGTAGITRAKSSVNVWALNEVRDSMQKLCPVCIDRFNTRILASNAGPRNQLTIKDVVLASRPIKASDSVGPFKVFAFQRQLGSVTLVLHHEASNTWLAPGMLWAGDVPDTRETDPNQMVKSLRILLAKTSGDAKFIPEQGPVATTQDFLSQLAYWEWLEATVKTHIEQGGNMPTKASDHAYPPFAEFKHYALRHALNLQRAWRLFE